jgi:hypothetical protein
MDAHDEGSRRSRGVPEGVFQWAGRKANEWLESDSDQSSSSRPSHHQTAHQPAEWHGQIPISPAESDHLRLLFKVRDVLLRALLLFKQFVGMSRLLPAILRRTSTPVIVSLIVTTNVNQHLSL